MWTLFWDMHSGGGAKEAPYEKIYIEAPQSEAEVIFYNRFGHSPYRVTCTCCGEDYVVHEHPTLADASAYHRNCDYDKKVKAYVERVDPSEAKFASYIPLDEYTKRPDVLVIRANEIKPEERTGHVPQQGYVWVG